MFGPNCYVVGTIEMRKMTIQGLLALMVSRLVAVRKGSEEDRNAA
jgi:hypothetical protein